MFNDLNEYTNPEQRDYDIIQSVENTYNEIDNNQDIILELVGLIGILEEDDLMDIEEKYGITEEEYFHPTREVIDKVTEYLKNHVTHSK